MRYFTKAVILTGLLSIGFTANPASAHCHASIEDARARLAIFQGSENNRKNIENSINKAEKFKDDKLKKKCGNILAKATKNLPKGSAKNGSGKKTKKTTKNKGNKKVANKTPKEKIPNKPLNTAVKAMDKNRDSKISREEWTGPKKQFDNADVNHDDELTVIEIAITLIASVDKNGNGLLDRSEWKLKKKDFNRIDFNGNYELTKEEYSADLGWERAGGRR